MAGFATVDITRIASTSGDGRGDFASGGWGDYRSELFTRGDGPLEVNDCRDLVEVPGEPEWRLRCLAEAFPQYCWKYVEPEVVAFYHYNLATMATSAPARQSTATLPVFYAHLPNSFSPYDFSVQPKSFARARERLYDQMQVVYSRGNEFEISSDQMCSGAACAVLVADAGWLRARIVKFSKGNDVLVDLVDIGNDNIISVPNLRPLLKAFGRLPPLAMRCRMKDVSMNELTAEKVNAFQELINSCGGIVRVELADVSSIPFLVNLYHPTMQGKNLGRLFYRREVNPEHEAARERRWNEKLARMNGDFSDEDEEEEIFEVNHTQPTHILHLDRLRKPVADEPLYISHIENRRFIYLHSKYHKQSIEKLEKHLLEKWSELKPIPERWLVSATACVYSVASSSNVICPYRVIIAKVGEHTVWIRSADHGWKKCLSKLDCLAGNLRLLTRDFSESPLMYLCRLPSSMHYHPHQSETDILRAILPVDTEVIVHCYRSKRTLPYKADMFLDTGELVVDVLEQLKAEKHVMHPCFDLVPYKPAIYTPSCQLDSDYQEDLEVFHSFARGCLEYANL